MKIYLLITNSRCDGGNESISVEPYENEAEVRKAFKEAIDSDAEDVKASGWETESNDDSYESFEPGYEMQNHYSVSIRTVELKEQDSRTFTTKEKEILTGLLENEMSNIKIDISERRRVDSNNRMIAEQENKLQELNTLLQKVK